jgi:hypothetical protein
MGGLKKICVGILAMVCLGCGERDSEKSVIRSIGSYRLSESSVVLLAEKELPDHDERKTALLIIMQGAPYDVFLESFELLADGYDRVGVGYHIPPY